MNDQIFDYYNIHDFLLAVSGPARVIFAKEFIFFKVDKFNKEPDLILKCCAGSFMTKVLRGTEESIKLPLETGDKELLYNPQAPALSLIAYVESLLNWPDKSIIHASAVTKDNKVYLFTGKENSGKTSAALNLIKRGFSYLSDDWSVIGGGKIYPFPKTIHIYSYNLSDTQLAKRIFNYRLFFYRLFFVAYDGVRRRSKIRLLNVVMDKYRPYFEVPLNIMFPDGKVGSPNNIVKVYYLQRQVCAEPMVIKDITATDLARRMSHYTFYEKGQLLYKEYARYVERTSIVNPIIEQRLQNDFNIMLYAFEGAELYRLVVPYNYDLFNVAEYSSLLRLEMNATPLRALARIC
jgi:hypothetical protein